MKRNGNVCLKILEALLFLFASVMFFRGFAFFASDLDKFYNQGRIFPIELAYFTPVYLLFVLHLIIYPESEKRYRLTTLVNGIIALCIGVFITIITSVYWAKGIYFFGDENFSALFPIELYLLALLSILFGGSLLYLWKKKDIRECFPYSGKRIRKILGSIFRPFYVLVALYFFGGLINCLINDCFYSSSLAYFPVYVLIVWNALVLLFYEFIVRNHGEIPFQLNKKAKIIVASSHFAFVSILTIAIYSLLAYNPYFVIENFQILLPLDFMGSLTLFLYLISIPSFGYALYFFILALKER
mgnify:FL=1